MTKIGVQSMTRKAECYSPLAASPGRFANPYATIKIHKYFAGSSSKN